MLTTAQVKQIQAGGIDWLGEDLIADGDYGPKTQWWHYVITQCTDLEQRIVRRVLAHKRAGVRDNGANRGLVVDTFMLPAGKNMLGKPWCIGAQSSVLRSCGADWPIHHVSTAAMLAWAAADKRILLEPRIGCAYGFLYPPGMGFDPGAGHGGIVIATSPGAEYVAVADGNVRDGYEVGLRECAPLTFVRTAWPNVSPVIPPKLPRQDGWRDR